MKCNCISYNRPDEGGTDPEVILDHAKYFPDTARPTICVDACIADQITALWAAGVRTGGCCCGHNGKSSIPVRSVFVINAEDAPKAHEVLSHDPRPWWIMLWGGAPQ